MMLDNSRPADTRNLSEAVQKTQIAKFRGWVVRRYLDDQFHSGLNDFIEEGMQPDRAFKRSRHSEVYLMTCNDTVIYVKRYPQTGIKAGLQSVFYRNRAQNAWRIGRMMRERGLGTPLPVFYLYRKISLTQSEYIVGTQGIKGGVSLKAYVRKNFKTGKNRIRQKRRFIKELAAFMARLHLNGIYHGDLTARNIFVSAADRDDTVHIQLIDLDAIRSTRWISSRRRIKNLDELGRNFLDLRVVDVLDRARFLRHYLKVYTKEKRAFRPFMETVAKRTAYRLKRHGQRFYKG